MLILWLTSRGINISALTGDFKILLFVSQSFFLLQDGFVLPINLIDVTTALSSSDLCQCDAATGQDQDQTQSTFLSLSLRLFCMLKGEQIRLSKLILKMLLN